MRAFCARKYDSGFSREMTRSVRRWLEEAVAQYSGELLPECYDDWIRLDRERLHDLVRTAQRKLLHLLDDSKDYEAALDIARGMLRLDPLDEEARIGECAGGVDIEDHDAGVVGVGHVEQSLVGGEGEAVGTVPAAGG